jgi:2-polyprenyl-3-methyl-5-hydroxy-6-metoxy-1,4-benzoquinol methylase
VNGATFELGNVPFYWRMLDSFGADRLGVPDYLPFGFSFRPELQLVIQRPNSAVLGWLNRVYRENANVGYLQDGHALSLPYGEEFLRFLDSQLAQRAPASQRATEIGCGGTYLLKMLKDRGIDVCGVDPSPVSRLHAQRAGIELIEDFYPTRLLSRKADLLFHHNVLEHVSDPVGFLRAHHADLNPDGVVATAVPDCTEHIEHGDLSMMLHEHLAYFDADSLALTLTAAGFRVLDIARSRFGGVLYGAARPGKNVPPTQRAMTDNDKFTRFCRKAERAIRHFGDWVRARVAAPNGLGFYVPLRAIPYLAACGIARGVRFFDDDPGIRGRYFAGIDVPVESFEDLKARPVDHLMICSHAFGARIAERVAQHFGGRIRIALLHELATGTAAA